MHTIRLGLGALLVAALGSGGACETASGSAAAATAPTTAQDKNAAKRAKMVETQLVRRGITDEGVLQAMRRVPRHEFVPDVMKPSAYADRPLPIGHDVTISQPYIVALMTQSAELTGDETVLEVGTGSGYQAAILSQLCRQVVTIERIAELAEPAKRVLEELGVENVTFVTGDGTLGCPEFAPYDAILVTAAAPMTPAPLYEQLRIGGRLIIPVGSEEMQELECVVKTEGEPEIHPLCGCRFVKLIGEHGWRN
jgi:protein-L-isoaspartate(D-aspartate) O-methyltransferase